MGVALTRDALWFTPTFIDGCGKTKLGSWTSKPTPDAIDPEKALEMPSLSFTSICIKLCAGTMANSLLEFIIGVRKLPSVGWVSVVECYVVFNIALSVESRIWLSQPLFITRWYLSESLRLLYENLCGTFFDSSKRDSWSSADWRRYEPVVIFLSVTLVCC